MQKDGEWQFVVGNDQGVLLDALCEEFFSPHSHPFERRIVIVPNASLKDFVLRHFVEHPRLQIVAGVQVLPLNQAIMEILDHFHCGQLSSEALRKRVPSFIELSLAIEELLLSPLADSQEFLPLSDYLGMEDREQRQRRIACLSDALAQCFVRYGLHGKAFLPVWMKEEGWQQKVWNALFSKDSPWTFPLECLEKPFTYFPGKVALFGFSFLPAAHLSFFSQISATLYHLSPCALFWADFASDRQRLSALRFFQRKGGSPKALEELDRSMQQGHPLLGNWGKLGREMLKILEAFSLSEKELYKEELPTSLLHKLQSSLLTLDESEVLAGDDSLQLHTAPSKLREVEVLCDSLRTLLHSREDPIRLRDVLIACPNIGDYAPYIHLVFANSGFSYAIEGVPLLYSSDVVREWMQLLELPQKNYGLSAVLKVLRCPALMEKWGFSKGDVAELGRWFKRAEIRQGLTGNPNSWEEGLDRLLCGLAISSDVPIVEHSGITLLNCFLEFFTSLRKDLALLSEYRSASEWMEFFLKLADKYFLIAWEKEPFFQELRALALSCTGLKSGQWSFESIARVLKHLCEKPTGSKGTPKQEKITFVPLSQGSIRSADILWCLGMDEEAFPRSDVHSSLCEMRTLKGDYCPSRGEEDSAVFLEMLLHAKKYLIFSCQRVHPEDGKHQGPSSLVDTLNQYLIKRGVAGGLVQIDHPAFPFDPLYFSAESKVKKWSQAEFLAAQARYATSPPPSHFLHFKPFSLMPKAEITVDIRQLKKLARNPLKLYFNETLKMYLNEEEDGEVAEFLITKVRKAMLRKHMVHTSVEQVMRQMEAQGKLPRGLFQQVAMREVAEEMEVLFKQLGKLGIKAEEMRAVRFFPRSVAERCSQPSLSLSLGDSTVVHIIGTLEDVTPQGLLAHVDNDLKGLVKVWPLYLIYRCMHPENQHLLLTKKGIQTQIALEDPKAALSSYLEYFLLSRRRPSLLMPQFAKALLEGGEAEFTSALLKEDKDPYLNYLKRHHLCFDSEEALALWATSLQKAFSRSSKEVAMAFDVLSRHLNVFEPHFLEASAGTGKTFAIEHLAIRLLIEGETPLRIEQILVVTFTRAATRELKARIRKNLASVKQDLSQGNSSIDYLVAICEKGPEAIKVAIDRIDAALICYDSAQIFTLHSFCHRLLTEFSLEAGVGFEVSGPDENAHVSVLESMIKEHLKEGVLAPQYSPVQMDVLLKKYRSDPRKLVSALIQLATHPCEIASLPTYAEIVNSFIESVGALPIVDASSLSEDLCALLPHYKQMTAEEIPSQIALLAEICTSRECTHAQFDRLLSKDFFLEGMCEENKKVRAKLPSLLHYPGLVDRMRKELLPFIHAAKDPSKITLRLAKDLQEKSLPLLERREKFSPDALLLKVEQALKRPLFAARARQKFCAAIVDEFQDTDPVQWTIFRELFLAKIDAVCLVGDPKQSIYAFRNADLYVYLEAAKVMGEAAKKYLDTNFRSTPTLVAALNALFSRAQGKWMHLPSSREALDVIPVKAAPREDTEEETSPIEFFVTFDKKGRSKRFPTADALETKVFPYLASEIFRLHAEKGIEYHDIAILIKDRFQGRDVIDYLAKCGIQASARRSRSILETEAFVAFKEVLAAICTPWDMSRVKTALGGPLIGWGEDLLRLGGEDPLLLDAKANMQQLHQLLFEEGFGSFFHAWLASTWGAAQVPLLEDLLSRGEESMYMDMRKLCELLVEAEMREGLKGEAFLIFLEELALGSPSDETRLKTLALEEKGSVTVMTMHMSKGLEFEVVFALGIASRHTPSDLLVVKEGDKKLLSASNPSDPNSLNALEEIDAEKMRQLYVALTRAKKRLYIPLFLEEENKGVEFGAASPAELFFARIAQHTEDYSSLYRSVVELHCDAVTQILGSLAPLIEYRVLERADPPCCIETKSPCIPLIPPSPLCLPCYGEPILSFSSLASHLSPSTSLKIDTTAPLSPHTMPLGAETGNLLHLLFEKIFKRGLHHPLNTYRLNALIAEEIALSPLQPWIPVLLPWMIELLTKSLLGFSLSAIPPDQVQQEMEFFFPTKNGMMKGFMDLFFTFEGKYYLLDWKSNYLGPSDADYSQENMAEALHSHQYDLQASIYAEALRRYVKLFDMRPFEECFGGAIYYFVRGKAVYHFIPKPLRELYE